MDLCLSLPSTTRAHDELTDIQWIEKLLEMKIIDSVETDRNWLNNNRIQAIKYFDALKEARTMIALAALDMTQFNYYEYAINWLF
jgi:hypothetical protein